MVVKGANLANELLPLFALPPHQLQAALHPALPARSLADCGMSPRTISVGPVYRLDEQRGGPAPSPDEEPD